MVYLRHLTHFGHRGMIENGWRPMFASVDEMDDTLVYNWNTSVRKVDRVYLLGDVSFKSRADTVALLEKLNGHIHVIRGNHDGVLDTVHRDRPDLFASYRQYAEIKIEGQKLILFHFPVTSWHGMHKGAWMLHGHCHGHLPDIGTTRMDVGVDPNGWKPVAWEEIHARLSVRPTILVDHHGDDGMQHGAAI